MRRIGNLYQKIYNIDNLILAEKNARKGKSKQIQVKNFNKDKLTNLHLILISEKYKTSDYKKKFINDGKKMRELSILPYYPDRILHHSLISIIKPILEKSFIHNTFSSIKHRGIHGALYSLNKNIKNYKFCLKIDIKKYYENVDHDILKSFLKCKIKDEKVLNLIYEIIDSYKIGIPIGNYSSQLFANFYLTKLDHWLQEKKKVKLFRYMDDICILDNDKEKLHILKREIEMYLNEDLKLTLSKYQVFPITQGIDFVGYVSYPTHIRLRKTIKLKMINKLKNIPTKETKASYWGWCKHCNSKNLTNKYFK